MLNISIKWLKKLTPIIGVFLFIYIISRVNFTYYFHNLPKTNWWIVLSIFPIMAITLLIRNWRWQIMLHKQNIHYSFFRSLEIYLSGIYLGAVTPGRVGELGRLYYLKKDKHSIVGSITTLLLDKIFDLALAFILALAGIVFYWSYLRINNTYLLLITAILILFLILNRATGKIMPKINKKIAEIKQQFKTGMQNYTFFDYLSLTTLTVISWFLYLIIAFITAKGVGISVGFWYSVMIMNLTTLISLLPISIMGLGTRESIFIFFYNIIGYPAEMAIAISMIILLVNLFAIFLGFCFWLSMSHFKPSSLLSSATEPFDEADHNHLENKP